MHRGALAHAHYSFQWESSMSSQTAWSRPSCLGQGGFLTLFVAFLLEGMFGLLKALAETFRLDIPTLGIYFGR